jgi:CRISPR-associated protein Cmr4
LALDPIHVGTGGYRLGRVDMSIVREPGTNLPKIPGTSLAGTCRAYAAMQTEGKFPRCAGQGQEQSAQGAASSKGHCGKPDCPICITFGSVGQERSFQGLAQLFDARIVLFPAHSLAGPVWVTCPDALRDWGIQQDEPSDNGVRVAKGVRHNGRLNIGWLMLPVAEGCFSLDNQLSEIPGEIRNRAVLISSSLFSEVVNANLEVRTSVSIDPATGAAAEGALFTYEALPRCTVLAFEAVFNDPKFYCIGGKRPFTADECGKSNSSPDQIQDGTQRVKETVEKGLVLLEVLGVGGMNTRGMGRLRVLNLTARSAPAGDSQTQSRPLEAKR